MENLIKWVALIAFFALMIAAFPSADAAIDPDLQETRYTTKVIRLADGSIRRRADVIAAFRKIHPCPSTGLYKGACAGWAIDHVIPLNNLGKDAVGNLQWLPNVLKSGKGFYPKDRWERSINAIPLKLEIMPVSGVLTIQ